MRIPLQRYWRLLAQYLQPQWPQLIVLALALGAGIGLRLAVPQIASAFIEQATTGGALATLLFLAGAFCLVGFVELALGTLATYLGSQIGWVATNNLRADLTTHSLALDLAFHHAHPPGEMIERINGDVQELSNFFAQFAVQLLGNLLLLLGVLALLLLEDWRIGGVFLAFTLLALVVFNHLRGRAAPAWQRMRDASGTMYGYLEDRLGGINDIRANGAASYVMRGFASAARSLFQRNRRAIAMSVIVGNGAELILALGAIAALGVGAWLYLHGAITLGTVYVITAYAALINRPLQEIINQVDDLQKAAAAIARIEQLRQMRPSIIDGTAITLGTGPLHISFNQVDFAYQACVVAEAGAPEEPVLHSISFELPAGAILGLIGRTGSGKTTLARLLLRLYDPTAGSIRFNGVDLRAATQHAVRSRIGVVTQDVHVFNTSLRNNATLFDPHIADAAIVQVLQELGLGSWLERLPAGLDTQLAASSLSAGEAQLLGIVRVFLRNPGLIILDEASSRLDPLTERLLEQAFDRLLQGRTAVIIAHRLETVQRADAILLLEQGGIKEYGPRAALASDPESAFARLLRLGGDFLGAEKAVQNAG